MTLDGVGVYAHSKWFSPDQALFKEKKSVREIFELTKIQQEKKFHASAIYLIKNGLSENLINNNRINLFSNFYELAVKSYEELGREETAKNRFIDLIIKILYDNLFS